MIRWHVDRRSYIWRWWLWVLIASVIWLRLRWVKLRLPCRRSSTSPTGPTIRYRSSSATSTCSDASLNGGQHRFLQAEIFLNVNLRENEENKYSENDYPSHYNPATIAVPIWTTIDVSTTVITGKEDISNRRIKFSKRKEKENNVLSRDNCRHSVVLDNNSVYAVGICNVQNW